ncbi:TIGR00266 family protein [Schlesneria paludicola]|uniref:TIGR00266 family protein n=1 Tax=Schlesneria paludicola TaxID=360056 RepID=UPI00029A33E3|nr:TIGR00266 family protein [Schlesneria paludicola]
MEFQIRHAPVFTVVEFQLNESEEVVAQPNSMISFTPGIHISAAIGQTQGEGSWFAGFKSLLGGESFFRAVFRAKRDAQTLLLAPDNNGDILPIELNASETWYLSRGSYLAHIGDCRLDARYGGVKGVLSKTGLFLLHVSGVGTLFCQTYGAIMERELGEGEQFLIDNRYVVAFSGTVEYELVKASRSLRHSFMSGEGMVNRYTGPGRVYYQTRAKPSLGFFGLLLNAMT